MTLSELQGYNWSAMRTENGVPTFTLKESCGEEIGVVIDHMVNLSAKHKSGGDGVRLVFFFDN